MLFMKRRMLIGLALILAKVVVAGVGVPTVNSPQDGAIIEDAVRPELVVNNSFGSRERDYREFLEYYFEVSIDSTFSTIFDSSSGVRSGESGVTSWRITKDCSCGTRYWWRCKSKGLLGDDVISSGWIKPVSFCMSGLDAASLTIDTALLVAGQTSAVRVTARNNFGPSNVEILIKKNGEGSFRSVYKIERSVFSDTTVIIQAGDITPCGVSYKIRTTDSVGNSKEVTGYLRVKVTNYTVPIPSWTWKMISFPLILDRGGIDSALGPLENRRVYRWNPVGKEYSKTYDAAIDPGDSFWFKIKEGESSDTVGVKVSGISVDPGNVPVISLPPGWSQVANPYCYKVASSKIKVKQDAVEVFIGDPANVFLENQFLTYDYDNSTGKMAYMNLPSIPSNVGFWVKNRSDKNVTIVFPESEVGATGLMLLSPSRKVKNDGWGLKLSVQSKDCIDADNYIGFLPGASDGCDFNDLSEPPPVENYVSLYFPHSDWGRDSGRYRTDCRARGDFGALEITNFDFVVETNVKEKTVLSWDVVNPPLNCCVTLYDKKECKGINLADVKGYAIDWSDGETRREFSMIVEWDNIFLWDAMEISDLDLNRVIDGVDLSIFGSKFGKTDGEDDWDSKVDLNKDKIVDGSDLFILGGSFGGNY